MPAKNRFDVEGAALQNADAPSPTRILREDCFPLGSLPKRAPKREGRKPHKSWAYRLRDPGVLGVRLETVVIGGTYWTSIEAFERFVAEVTRRRAAVTPQQAPDAIAQAVLAAHGLPREGM